MAIEHDKSVPRYDIKQVVKLFNQGVMPSQIGVQLNISLNEVLDALEKYRKDNAPNDAAKKTI
jgi:hypothetical protein